MYSSVVMPSVTWATAAPATAVAHRRVAGGAEARRARKGRERRRVKVVHACEISN
jgi:hypothetical protein